MVGLLFSMMSMYDKETFLPDECFSPRASKRWAALRTYKAPKNSALESLEMVLSSDPSPLVRAEALECICRNFPHNASSAIKTAYDTGIPLLRRTALYLIDSYRLESSTKDVVTDALKSGEADTVALAEKILKRLPDSERKNFTSSTQKQSEEHKEAGDNSSGDGERKP
jgi:hypothetical protein